LKAGLEMNNSHGCERGPDLIAFLYDEADEGEAREFQLHLRECSSCRGEVASFGIVRESITAWRDEALSGFVSSSPATPAKTKSALAALRQFFDLSPLWLKGATALAAITFCVLAGLAIVKRNNDEVSSAAKVNQAAVYTEQDVNRIVQEALAKQQSAKPPVDNPGRNVIAVAPAKPKSSRISTSNQFAKSRGPLSRAEREQLAADLRLLSTSDEAALNLLGERINQ
jgi:anti-sigma factor RsiW